MAAEGCGQLVLSLPAGKEVNEEAKVSIIGPRPLNLTGQHGHFLKSTGDIRLTDMRLGNKNENDMRHAHLLNSTCDVEKITNM